MRISPLNYTNPDTGEVTTIPVVYQEPRAKANEDFVMIFQRKRLELAKANTLTARDYRVLAYLEAIADYSGALPYVTGASIARDLDLDRSNVSKALHRLEAENVLEKDDKTKAWRFQIDAVWKGDLKDRESFRLARMRARSATTNQPEPKP